MANSNWTPQDMTGKTVIVTGANSGIGKETANALAGMGVSRLIMACRNQESGQEARDEIVSKTGNQGVVVKLLDLSSMASVRAFAEDILASEERLDVLVNNAGILASATGRQVTQDGFEVVMATNHLGHHLLTTLLLPLLRKSAPARVVVVSSNAYKSGKLDLTDLQSEKSYSLMGVYAQSKIANILFAKELAKRLEGTGVTVNSLHPGVVRTNIASSGKSIGFLFRLFVTLYAPFMKTSTQGAATSLYLAAAQEVEGVTGKFFEDCRQVALNAAVDDPELARKLWEESDRLTGLTSETVTQ